LLKMNDYDDTHELDEINNKVKVSTQFKFSLDGY